MELTFYKTGFKPEQNGVYEHVDEYLSALTPTHLFRDVKTFGYFGLREVVRLPLSGRITPDEIGDYCVALDDGTNKDCKYFVLNASWKAKETVEVELLMDTLTTFWSDIKGNVGSKTHIRRRTKTRWLVSDIGQTALFPVIDNFAEPFNVQFIQAGETSVTDYDALLRRKWHVVWLSKVFDIQQSTESSTSSIDIQPSSYALIPDGALPYKMEASPYATLTPSNIPCGNTG